MISHEHHHHHTLAPSGQGTVVLNIGEGIGALVVHTPGSLHGHEIEVSPVTDPGTRKHAAVRARIVRGGVSFAMVVDGLLAGRYTVWRDPVTALAEVDVPDGGVAEFAWPATATAAA